jgi:hypothetical protein
MGTFGFDIMDFVNRSAREAGRQGQGQTRAQMLEEIRRLEQTVDQLRNRWQTVQIYAKDASSQEFRFAKEAAWDQGVLGAANAFFTTGKITLLVATLGKAGPALWAAGNAATAGQAVLQATLVCGKLLVKEAVVHGLKALAIPKLGEAQLHHPASPDLGCAHVVQLADALMRAVVDAKEETWKQVQGTASARGIRVIWAGKEVSAAAYWAYWKYVNQCYNQIQDMIRQLMRLAQQDANALRSRLAELDRKGHFSTPLP